MQPKSALTRLGKSNPPLAVVHIDFPDLPDFTIDRNAMVVLKISQIPHAHAHPNRGDPPNRSDQTPREYPSDPSDLLAEIGFAVAVGIDCF
jgi:hypothetical protein